MPRSTRFIRPPPALGLPKLAPYKKLDARSPSFLHSPRGETPTSYTGPAKRVNHFVSEILKLVQVINPVGAGLISCPAEATLPRKVCHLPWDKYRATKPRHSGGFNRPSQAPACRPRARRTPARSAPRGLCLNLSLYSCQFFLCAPPPQTPGSFRFSQVGAAAASMQFR